MLIRQIYTDNNVLLNANNKNFMSEIIDTIFSTIKDIDNENDEDYWNCHILESLRMFIHHEGEVISDNQNLIMSKLCNIKYGKIIIHMKKDDYNMDKLLTQFQLDLESGEQMIELNHKINYFSVLLFIFSLSCKGMNTITESKCKSFYPIRYCFLYVQFVYLEQIFELVF